MPNNAWAVVLLLLAMGCGPGQPPENDGPMGPEVPDTATVPPESFTDVAPGLTHSCALGDDGRAFCWGENQFGQTGDGTANTADALRPVEVVGDHRFESLAAGERHTCGVTDAREVWCWGHNSAGQLGLGTSDGGNHSTPSKVIGLPAIDSITAGWNHACGLDDDGGLWCWGRMGLEMAEVVSVPIAVQDSLEFAQVSAGGQHTCGVRRTGGILCWGSNRFLELGSAASDDSVAVPPSDSVFAQAASGGSHSCAVTGSGAALCWGDAVHGQLGHGDDTAVHNGTELHDIPVVVSGGYQLIQVSGGDSRTCGLTVDGAALCWGGNYAGGLGDGTNTKALEPVEVSGGLDFRVIRAGPAATCAISSSGDVYCWGPNTRGQVGDGTRTARSVPVRVAMEPAP